ncbi:ras GEF [Lentinus brumalis]|uniref:Ras GEF n=1 Tax=Lentinus brumalis TaxID=2498619 RepID=A0A371DLF1_9APHY|nr:ras GEF [Polyporus brumalis]
MYDSQPSMSYGQSQTPSDEQYISTFFCRALYDYQTNDSSSLSFRKGDIIEVLTQLESGWWDGLLNDERGWFPSNYVTMISDTEAEAALNGSEYPGSQASLPDDSMVDMSQALSQSDHDGDWLNGDGDYGQPEPRGAGYSNGAPARGGGTQTHDFWVPQVSQDGRIFYVNTQTGQQSQDLPTEAEGDEEAEVAALSPQASRAGPSAALGLASGNGGIQDGAGFGIPKRTRTPEPWVRRLADDGMSYYYVNRLDGQVSWTVPDSGAPPSYTDDGIPRDPIAKGSPATSSSSIPRNGSSNGLARDTANPLGRLRTRERSDSSIDRLSIHSDDSEVYPSRRDRSESTTSVRQAGNGVGRSNVSSSASSSRSNQAGSAALELTAAEESAKALQEALTPPSPETAVELSNQVRETISTVLRYLRASSNSRRPEQYREVDQLVMKVVAAVRNLLYVTATPSGHVPSHLYPRDPRDPRLAAAGQTLQSHLKAAHRKVAGTLSKLVLSALAMQYDPALSASDKPNRMESDVAELERAVVAFVGEVQFYQEQHALSNTLSRSGGGKRLYGVFSTANLGLGLPGGGVGGDWRGFGYVAPDDGSEPPQRTLNDDVVIEFKGSLKALEARLGSLVISLRYLDSHPERVSMEGQSASAYLSWMLRSLCGVNVARHVDVDGIRPESGLPSASAQYMQLVDRARSLVRTLEVTTQALYDDGATIFIAVQALGRVELISLRDRAAYLGSVETTAPVIRANCVSVAQTLENLLALGHDQAAISQGDYRNSIEWRMSRINMADGSIAALTSRIAEMPGGDDEFVDMEHAFAQPAMRIAPSSDSMSSQAPTSMYSNNINRQPSQSSLDMSDRSRSDSVAEPDTPTWTQSDSMESTLIAPPSPEMGEDPLDDETAPYADEEEPAIMSKSPPRAGKGNKLMKILGAEAPQHYISKLNAEQKPWYLRPNYDQSEILIDPDGGVRAGTPSALVERLTAHELGDPTFIKNFLMTFKSFMTVDQLFELLTTRFWISPPPNLKPNELEEWTRLKQQVIRMRVLNTFRTMVTDDDILEKEDMYILGRMKEFASNEEVVTFAAAKQLLILIERAQRGGDAPIKTTNTVPLAPPAPILPKSSKKLKLLDIDPLELARQITLMEAALYKKIRPMECLQRSREAKPGKTADNITTIIQLSNRIANWVAESVLAREDSQKRARVVKHFINVADRCRLLQNFSTMTAVISGLNTPPIRRLKRTWEQVNAKFMSQLKICESTIDTNKNFNNYRSLLARIQPPCVPFIGVYLTTLTFINDGAEDKLAGNMINFRKRQKAAEVIQDIKRWQAKPYNFQTVASVLTYLEESFQSYQDGVDYGDQFWNLSLEREPREREDEKMARLLQESGFL